MGDNRHYDLSLTGLLQLQPEHSFDHWKPIQGKPFHEVTRAGDDGMRRVLEMVCAAVIPSGL